jgi:hypothetical protein
MPVLTYTADFREKDGEVISRVDFLNNVQQIQNTANRLNWTNVDRQSLDSFHVARGEATKSVDGMHKGRRNFSSGTYVVLCECTYAVSPGCAVYAIGEVSWTGRAAQYNDNELFYNLGTAGPVDPIGDIHSPSNIRLSADDANGLGIGTKLRVNASNPEVHGSAGLVWAYTPTGTSDDVFNHMSLEVQLAHGQLGTSDTPAFGNLTVFVVHR